MKIIRTHRLSACGFTLIELMVTLAVVVILAVIAIPNFQAMVLNVRRDSVVDGLVSSLHYARSQALNFNQTTVMCAGTQNVSCNNDDWNSGWQVVSLPAESSSVALANHALEQTATAPKIAPINGSTSFQFTGQGLVKNAPSSGYELLVVCDSRGATSARAVFINRTGYIQASPTPGTNPNDGTALTCNTSTSGGG